MPTQENGQPTDLLIKANELLHLNNIIENLPTKFGLPLVQFFSQVAGLRKQEAVVAQQLADAESKKTLLTKSPEGESDKQISEEDTNLIKSPISAEQPQ